MGSPRSGSQPSHDLPFPYPGHMLTGLSLGRNYRQSEVKTVVPMVQVLGAAEAAQAKP